MEFENKIIYIISREGWGGMLMSKQHYALELAKRGNQVYFINHPDLRKKLKRGAIKVEATNYKNLFSVDNRLFHPYFFKEKYKGLYNFFTRFHIKRMVREIGNRPDIVWTFDPGNSLPLKFFPKCEVKIVMPVDGPFGLEDEIKSTEKADVLISITREILERYKYVKIPQFQINHGVSGVFINEEVKEKINSPIHIGYSGSLVRNDLDTENFLKIIQFHSDKIFEFWGENDYMKSNIHLPQDVSDETKKFIDDLKALPNVILHGTVNPEVLAAGIKRMDALLICYLLHNKQGNLRNDQNHHKVLEYLGTGKAIISSYMSVYSIKYPGFIEMVKSKENNDELFDLFNKVISDLSYYNSLENQNKRINFAKQFTYSKQVENIEAFINSTLS